MKKEAKLFGIFIVIILFSFIIVSALGTSTGFVKVSLKQGNTLSKFFSVISEKEGSVNLEVNNLEGVSLEEDSFYLNSGEARNVNIQFDSSSLESGIYFGFIKITFDNQITNLPVIFEVESSDVLFDVDVTVPPVYLESYAGSKMIIQANIYDLTFGTDGLHPVNIDVDYMIHSDEGVLVYSESDSVLVDKEVKLSKSIQLPNNLKKGTYFITTVARYKNSVGVSTTLFDVSSRFLYFLTNTKDAVSGSGIGVIILVIFVVAGGVCLLMYFLHDRDKLFLEMRKSQKDELQQQRNFLMQQQKFLVKEKKVPVKEVKVMVKEKVKELKTKQKKRIREFKKLRKQTKIKKGSSLKGKLEDWKSKGYDTTLLNAKLKGVDSSDMKGLMKKWREQGYK